MRPLIVAALIIAIAGCVAAVPPNVCPEGAKSFTIAAGQTVKVPFNGKAASVGVQADTGDVRWATHALLGGSWQRILPTQTVKATPASALGDTTGLVLEGEYHEFAGRNSTCIVLVGSATAAVDVRLFWELAK